MNNLRNIVMLSLLAIFFAGYGATWAYRTQFREPRTRLNGEIAKYRQETEKLRQSTEFMNGFDTQQVGLYYRSLPQIPNDALTNYQHWLREVLKFADVDGAEVETERSPQRTRLGVYYRFHVRAKFSLDQLSRFLFEFYFAPFLHRVNALSIAPVEGHEDQVAVAFSIEALGIPAISPQHPYPLQRDLPTGFVQPRLRSGDFETYRVIAGRNLLQAAKGGVDRADYAFLTALNRINGEPEIWISVRTDDSVVRAKRGETVRVGSFIAEVVDILDQDVVFQRGDMRWLVTLGDSLSEAFALPPEAWRGE